MEQETRLIDKLHRIVTNPINLFSGSLLLFLIFKIMIGFSMGGSRAAELIYRSQLV